MAVEPTDHETNPQLRTDAKWLELLRLIDHEVRQPLTPLLGYINMLLRGSVGPLPERQRRLLEEIQKSCHRFSTLATELSVIAQLESGTAKFNRGRVDLRALLTEVIANLPRTERPVDVELRADAPAAVHGDANSLKDAFGSIIIALRRELVTSEGLTVVLRTLPGSGGNTIRITVSDAERIDQLESLGPADLATFNEWRGSLGLSVPLARRIIEAHGGRLLAPIKLPPPAEEDKLAAFIYLPVV